MYRANGAGFLKAQTPDSLYADMRSYMSRAYGQSDIMVRGVGRGCA